jgi:ribose/xylose/arabinose/galactoside ABC-type transport system permease subunit
VKHIYKIDGAITHRIQVLSQWLYWRAFLSVKSQGMLVAILAVPVVFVLLDTIGRGKLDLSMPVVVAFVGGIVTMAGATPVMRCVGMLFEKLHMLLDEEAALKEDKQYGDGYAAWATVFSGICLLALSALSSGNVLQILFIFIGWFLVFPATYEAFASRGKTRTKKPKQKAQHDHAWQRLMQACKGWLPIGTPVKQPIRSQ